MRAALRASAPYPCNSLPSNGYRDSQPASPAPRFERRAWHRRCSSGWRRPSTHSHAHRLHRPYHAGQPAEGRSRRQRAAEPHDRRPCIARVAAAPGVLAPDRRWQSARPARKHRSTSKAEMVNLADEQLRYATTAKLLAEDLRGAARKPPEQVIDVEPDRISSVSSGRRVRARCSGRSPFPPAACRRSASGWTSSRRTSRTPRPRTRPTAGRIAAAPSRCRPPPAPASTVTGVSEDATAGPLVYDPAIPTRTPTDTSATRTSA